MLKKWLIGLALLLPGLAYAQNDRPDSSTHSPDPLLIDTTLDYDALFRDFTSFMDSILSPRNYFLVSVSAGKNYYNYETRNTSEVKTVKKILVTPLVGYYHNSGWGLTATGYIVEAKNNLNFYQFSLSPSYDYLKNKKLAAGISYTRFFTKDSLPFYTTPLQNELYAYFLYRKAWLRPGIAVSYGWGSRSDLEKREVLIQNLRLRRRGFIFINTKESISDFSLMPSVRHDAYWLDVFGKKDFIRFSPQLMFTCGTQKFGFNQSSNVYATLNRNTGGAILFNSENVQLDDELKFQPLSLTLSLKGEYSVGKFYIQPQLVCDYYFPAESKNLSTLFSVNAGFIF